MDKFGHQCFHVKLWFLGSVFLIACLALGNGCTMMSHGRWSNIERTDVNKLRIGVTTEADVLASFGEPQRIVQRTDGLKILGYSHGLDRGLGLSIPFLLSIGRTGGTGQTLNISFRGGVVSDYEYSVDQRNVIE